MDKQPVIDALEEYVKTSPQRTAMINAACNDADIIKWKEAEAIALGKVQQAYYEVTKAINSRQKCNLISLSDAMLFVRDAVIEKQRKTSRGEYGRSMAQTT